MKKLRKKSIGNKGTLVAYSSNCICTACNTQQCLAPHAISLQAYRQQMAVNIGVSNLNS